MNSYDTAEQAALFLKDKMGALPSRAIITGTGSSSLLEGMEIKHEIPSSVLPHMTDATYLKGSWILASLNGVDVLVLNGRLHYYEGFSMEQVTFAVRVMSRIGIEELVMTNASGGLNPDYEAGELVLIRDHINLLPEHPLRGDNDDRFGLRFPDMSNAYDAGLRDQLQASAQKTMGKTLNEAVYVGLQGPSLETPAEYKMLHIIGGDLVGMSTVPEVIVANHCGIRTAVISIVTNVCYPPEVITETTLEAVVALAERVSRDHLGPMVRAWVSNGSEV